MSNWCVPCPRESPPGKVPHQFQLLLREQPDDAADFLPGRVGIRLHPGPVPRPLQHLIYRERQEIGNHPAILRVRLALVVDPRRDGSLPDARGQVELSGVGVEIPQAVVEKLSERFFRV